MGFSNGDTRSSEAVAVEAGLSEPLPHFPAQLTVKMTAAESDFQGLENRHDRSKMS